MYAANSTDNLPESISCCIKDDQLPANDFVFYKGFTQPLGLDFECNHVVNQPIYIDGHDPFLHGRITNAHFGATNY